MGWGEAQAPLAPEVSATIVNLLLRAAIEGEPFDGSRGRIEELWERMYCTMRVRGQTGGFMLDAIAGVDLALWDLGGKIAGVPVAAMLGSARTTVPAYLSGVAGATLGDKMEYARRYRDQGFSKCKIYYESDWPAVLDQVAALRSGFGDVAVDALWHLDPALAPSLDPLDALWLECPIPPEDPAAHERLAASITTPLALGESYRTVRELEPFFERRVMRYVQPDLGRCGITESLRIAARAAGLEVVPHVSIALGPQIAAAIHFSAAACDLCEFNPRVLEVANRFLGEPIRMDGASYVIPTRPGLGIDIDENSVAAVSLQ